MGMTKGALTKALAEKCEVKNGVVSTLLSTLASIATAEAKKNGKFVIPGVVMIKTRQKKATKAGKRDVRPSRHGEGEASKDHRQGFPRESNQGRVLRVSRSAASPAKRLRACSSTIPFRGIFVSFCTGWLEGTWSFMAFWSHDARRGRLYVLHICFAEK